MITHDRTIIEQRIHHFRAEYEARFHELMTALDEAGISHYSSGCGIKNITFDIFPASAYVREILSLLTLDRSHREKQQSGFKDASAATDYNPAHDFASYLRRWTLFAEQAMRHEGASDRGIAAARAKLLMADLMDRLGSKISARAKVGRRKSESGTSDFFDLLESIGKMLEAREAAERFRHKANHRQTNEHNYLQALAAAQGVDLAEVKAA